MAETGIQRAFESPGVFWLPEKPDQKITGHLSHSLDDGPEVSLVGGFDHSLLKNFNVVHGVLEDAPCTLFNCKCISSKGSYFGLRQMAFKADLLVVGEHVLSLDEPVFNGATFRFGGLDEWVSFSAVKINFSETDIAKTPSRFDLLAQPPIVASSAELGGRVTLCGYYSGRFGHRKIDWTHHSFFEIEFGSAVSINVFYRSVFELQHLFALLTWTRAPVSYLSARRYIAKTPMNQSGKQVSGLYGHWTATSEEDKTSSRDLFTSLALVWDDLPHIIVAWFKSSPAIKTARQLLTSIVRSEGQYLEFKFLALMQTAEALHRSLDARKYMPAADYEKVRQALIAAIPGAVERSHRTSLESRIKYGNDLSLRTRLKELFFRLPEKLRPHVFRDGKALVDRAVDMRNTLVHPNTEGDSAQPDPNEIWRTTQRIKLLLTIVLLNELGLSFDKIETIAKSGQWYPLFLD